MQTSQCQSLMTFSSSSKIKKKLKNCLTDCGGLCFNISKTMQF